MAHKGYSRKFVRKFNTLNSDSLGVRLAKLCMAHGYSAAEIAEVFDVSRQTVYNWMMDKRQPAIELHDKIKNLIARLEIKPLPSQHPAESETNTVENE